MNVIALFTRFAKGPQYRKLKYVQVTCQRHFSDETSSETGKEQTTSETNKEQTDEVYDENVKQKILNASMSHVLELGWSKDALAKGAESLGYPGVAHGLFPRGGAELLQYFYADCNKQLAQKLKKESEESTKIVPMDFIQNAVEMRLRMNVPYLPRWSQALAIMALPPNVPHSLAALLTLVDDICYYAGDRSVDIKWYARRVALGTVYKTTELYLIQDKSEDHKETWLFLSRRLEELFQIHSILNQSEQISNQAKDTVTSAFITARNILGINWNR